MELYKLQYFLAAARHQNLHKAALELHNSVPSTSKAIQSLEESLGTKLFERVGRNIQLTQSGKHLKIRAHQMMDLASSIKTELAPEQSRMRIRLAGREFLLSEFGLRLIEYLREQYPFATFDLVSVSGVEAFRLLDEGDVDFAVTIQEALPQFKSVVVGEFFQVTCGSAAHPIFGSSPSKKQTHPIEDVLKHSFVSPNEVSFVDSGSKQSIDGWRDDKFPRRIFWRTDSVELLSELLLSGQALAYVPDFWAQRRGLKVLKITGCQFVCQSKVYISTRRSRYHSWQDHFLENVFRPSFKNKLKKG